VFENQQQNKYKISKHFLTVHFKEIFDFFNFHRSGRKGIIYPIIKVHPEPL
jgi:hypothetical protein